MTLQGLPHSDICGSRAVCASPQLFAAYHVLHRQSVPRHPSHACIRLAERNFQLPTGNFQLSSESGKCCPPLGFLCSTKNSIKYYASFAMRVSLCLATPCYGRCLSLVQLCSGIFQCRFLIPKLSIHQLSKIKCADARPLSRGVLRHSVSSHE